MKTNSSLPLVMLVCFGLSIIMAMWEWTDRNVEYVCTRVTGHQVEVLGIWTLMATFTGPVCLVFNVGTEIYAATEEKE